MKTVKFYLNNQTNEPHIFENLNTMYIWRLANIHLVASLLLQKYLVQARLVQMILQYKFYLFKIRFIASQSPRVLIECQNS